MRSELVKRLFGFWWGPVPHQRDVGASTLITEYAYVFEAHQRLEDLTRIDSDEGASCF
jgi:hypothetical protein